MLTTVRITSALVDPALIDLPWSVPLEQWPADQLVALPQGISRHVVRFVRLAGTVYAVKETASATSPRARCPKTVRRPESPWSPPSRRWHWAGRCGPMSA